MIKNFLKITNDRIDAHEIDTETGRIKIYCINKGEDNCGIDFPYSEYETTAAELGYSSTNECLRELKRRKILGDEVPHDRQRANEIGACLLLAQFRYNNGWNLADIPEKLSRYYNLPQDYINKIIEYITRHNLERHTVRIFTETGDSFTTEINGTPAEIIKHYDRFESIEFIA